MENKNVHYEKRFIIKSMVKMKKHLMENSALAESIDL